MGGFIVGSAVGAVGMNAYINHKAYYGDLPWLNKNYWESSPCNMNRSWSVDETVRRVREIMKEKGITTQDLERGYPENHETFEKKEIFPEERPRPERRR